MFPYLRVSGSGVGFGGSWGPKIANARPLNNLKFHPKVQPRKLNYPRIRAGTDPNPSMLLGEGPSGPSPGTPGGGRTKTKTKNRLPPDPGRNRSKPFDVPGGMAFRTVPRDPGGGRTNTKTKKHITPQDPGRNRHPRCSRAAPKPNTKIALKRSWGQTQRAFGSHYEDPGPDRTS